MRLIAISAGTICVVLIVLLSVHFWGLSRPYKKFETSFFQNPSDIVYVNVRFDDDLKTIISTNPNRKWIFNVLENKRDIHTKVVEGLSALKDEQVMIQSPHNIVLSSIKNLKPLWLYGTGSADLMRFRIYQSLGILSATPFEGDVFIFTPQQYQKRQVTDKILTELKRRFKYLVIGPVSNSDELNSAKSLVVDVVLLAEAEIK